LKEKIYQHVLKELEAKIEESQIELDSIRSSRDNNSKSTAGDKHEVGRAMAQIELDNQTAVLHRTLKLKETLIGLDLGRNPAHVGKGSLVITNRGKYFVSIGLGAIQIEGESIFVISLSSPIGTLLDTKSVGDVLEFNEQRIEILDIQ